MAEYNTLEEIRTVLDDEEKKKTYHRQIYGNCVKN